MNIKDTQELIQDFIDLEAEIAQLQENKDRVEQELRKRMDAEGATALPHPTHEVELKKTMAYDHAKLIALHELVDPDELQQSGAYTPAWRQTIDVPEHWNMVKVKPFARYGDNVKAVIKGAAYVSKLTLSITEKQVKS